MSGGKRPLVYWMPIAYPNAKAHSIQVTRTLQAVSARRDAYLVVQRRPRSRDWREEVRAAYGLEPRPGFRLLEVPKAWLTPPLLPLALQRVAREVPGAPVFYARRYPIAATLLATRFLHGCPLIFESHKKEGFRKEDRVEESPFAERREAIEAGNHPPRLMRRVYTRADAVAFLHEHSMKIAQQALSIRRAAPLWYGIDTERLHLGGERTRDLVFCGSLGAHKLFDLVPEALLRSRRGACADVFGGSDAELRHWKARAAALGLGKRLRFLGRVPYRELRQRLRDYRYGILTLEGIKLVDYLENGVVPILPRLPSFTELFSEGDLAYFRPDDPESLARCIDAQLEQPRDTAALARIAEQHPLSARGRSIDALADAV